MSVALQAVVSLDASRFTGGLHTMQAAANNATQAMMAAFGGLGGEVLALGHAFGAVGAVVGILKDAATHGAAFEQSMANVRSVTGLSAVEIKQLGAATLEFAKNTRYSSAQAADALYALGSAGIGSAEDLMSALKPALLLAGATMADTGMATEAVTSTVQNLGLKMSDAARVADQFAGVIAASPANMSRLSEALKYAAPAAGAFGVGLESMVKELGAFHLAGLKGEQAGTAYRMAILELAEAAKTGGTVVSSALQGWTAKQEGLTGAVRRFEAAGITADQVALEFGARSGTGLAAMINVGSAAIDDMGRKVGELADVQRMYAVQMNTLTGDVVVLGHHLQMIGHIIYEEIEPALRSMVELMTQATDWVGRLTEAMVDAKWGEAWEQLSQAARVSFAFIQDKAATVVDGARAAIANTDWAAAWAGFRSAFVGVVGFVFELRTAITDGLTQALSRVNADTIKDAFAEIGDTVRALMPTIEASFVSLWGFVRESARVAVDFVRVAWGELAEWLGGFSLKAKWDGLTADAQAAADWIRATLTAGLTAMATELQALLAAVPAPMREGFGALLTSLENFGKTAVAAIGPAVDLVTNLGTSLVTAAGNSGLMSKAAGWMGTLADATAHVVNIVTRLTAGVSDAVAALAGIAGSDAFVWALETGFRALGFAVDLVVGSVHIIASALDGLAGIVAGIPGPVLHVAAAIAGGAGLAWAMGILETRLVAAIAQLRTFIAVELLNLRTALPGLISQVTNLGSSMGAMGKAGLVTGAAIAGWELGRLIRELPGVAAWCDDLAEKLFKLTGAFVEQDPALEARVKQLRAQRQEQERASAAASAAASATRANAEAVTVAVEATEDVATATKRAVDAFEAVGAAVGEAQSAVKPLGEALGTVNAEAEKGPHTMEPLEEAAKKVGDQAKNAADAFKGLGNAAGAINVGINISLPTLSGGQVKYWQTLLGTAQNPGPLAMLKAAAVNISVTLTNLQQTQVGLYERMVGTAAKPGPLSLLKSTNVQIAVALAKLDQNQVPLWERLIGTAAKPGPLSLLKGANYSVSIALPHLTENQVGLWTQFFSGLQSVKGGLSLPKLPGGSDDNASRIAVALEKLVAMKGIIWT